MYSFEILQKPDIFLETLIEDTFLNKVQWETFDMDYGTKSDSTVNIPDCTKYLKFEFYEMGTASFIKTIFYKGFNYKDIVEFESINARKERERLVRLSQAIKRQIDTRSNSDEYKLLRRQKLISEINKILKN